MFIIYYRIILLIITFTLNSCTTITVTPIDHAGNAVNDALDGVRFYRPKPYLLVTALSNKTNNESSSNTYKAKFTDQFNCNYELQFIYLPDYTTGYIISTNSWWRMFGTASMSPQLENGWKLTGLSAAVDSKTPETITAVAELVTAAKPVGLNNNNFDDGKEPPPQCDSKMRSDGLYELNYEKGVLTGFKKHNLPLNILSTDNPK